MLRWMDRVRRRQIHAMIVVFLTAGMTSWVAPKAFAMIIGGEGNKPIADPGWPSGAAVIFNTKSRIAWWEGPPFGGGQWRSECRGDAKAFNEILLGFAKLDAKRKRVIVHDGVGGSFWLNPNGEPSKQESARIDWVLMVWQADRWDRFRSLPADLKPGDMADAKNGPPAQIDVFAGGNIRWVDVSVPKGLEVVDQRLEAHGFTIADGNVLEGKLSDLSTNRSLSGRVSLELIEPQPKGGYRFTREVESGY